MPPVRRPGRRQATRRLTLFGLSAGDLVQLRLLRGARNSTRVKQIMASANKAPQHRSAQIASIAADCHLLVHSWPRDFGSATTHRLQNFDI